MNEDPKVLLAAECAALARQRLIADLTELRARISPGSLASSVASGLKSKSVEAVESGVDVVRENRWAAAGVATLGALFLARRPIAAMFDVKSHENDETSGRPARSNDQAASSKDTT